MPMPLAPIPWMPRPAMKASMSGASAHSRLPAKKKACAMSMMGLRPQMSATEPHTGVTVVLPRMKAPPTQM